MNKKAQGVIDGLQGLVIPLVGIGIVLVIGFLIMSEVKDQSASTDSVYATNCTLTTDGTMFPSSACNATTDVQIAMQDIPGWLPIIVITVIGALLLSLVAVFRGQ